MFSRNVGGCQDPLYQAMVEEQHTLYLGLDDLMNKNTMDYRKLGIRKFTAGKRAFSLFLVKIGQK